jgi:hypothetical protein
MGPSGTTDFCDQVLKGKADLTSFSPSLQAIFQQLENPPDVEVDDVLDAARKGEGWTMTSGRTPRGTGPKVTNSPTIPFASC